MFVNILLCLWEEIVVGRHVLHIKTLSPAISNNDGLGSQATEPVVQGMISHVCAVAGCNLWGRRVNLQLRLKRI